ncbi:MAG: efflux RND transporter permease subunit [Albidovulum sp.]|nr:efflux RND transporter permease subunit [Albidovulum sp.]
MTSETNNGGTAETKRWLGIAQFAVIILVIAVALYFARAPARVDRGPIAVAGVIVNDALVLLDRYNTIRRENIAFPAVAAASAAARDRFRAVFLTSLTTVLGLSPLLYERSDELIFLVPFVVSMLGGLVAATAFTLFMLPALVMLFEGRREV